MLRRKLRAMLMARKTNKKIYLYNQGDTCDDITGGWTITQSNNTFLENNCIRFNYKTVSTYSIRTNKLIDLTDKIICFELNKTDNRIGSNCKTFLDLSKEIDGDTKYRYTVITSAEGNDIVTKKMKVQSGEFYIRLAAYYQTCNVYKIWLEDKDVI